MVKTVQVEVITPSKLFYKGDAELVIVTTREGDEGFMGGKGAYREDYVPMIQQVQHVEYGNAEAMDVAIKNLQTVGEKVAGVIIEPIQGEAGVQIPPEGYLKAVREICDKYGVAMICDEIQTGMGRTGTMWRVDHAAGA